MDSGQIVAKNVTSEKCVPVLRSLVVVSESLRQLMMPGFGPNGLKTMLTTSTGQVLITNSGSRVLRSLCVSHPIGKMIVSAAVTMQGLTGDYSKTFVILLSGLVSRISDHIGIESQRQSANACHRIALKNAVSRLRRTLLPDVLVPAISTKFSVTDVSSDNVEASFETVKNLIKTCLGSKQSPTTADHLAGVLCELLLALCCDDITKLRSTVQLCIDSFDLLCIDGVGEHPTSSHSLDGVLIQKNFLYHSPELASMQAVRFVILKDITDVEDDGEARLSAKNATALDRALKWKTTSYNMYFRSLRDCSVSLLLSNCKVSELVNNICSSFNISTIQFVQPEDIDRISEIASIHPVCTLSDLEQLEAGGHIATVNSCKTVTFGGQTFIHLKDFELVLKTVPKRAVKQLIVCGPSAGICQELKFDLCDALKAVAMWLNCDMMMNVKSIVDINSDNSKSSGDRGYAVLGGGTFEILLYTALKDLLRPDSKHFLTDSERFVCKILQESLLEIPALLVRNSYKPSQNSSLYVQQIADTSVAEFGECYGINGRTGRPNTRESQVSVVEPVNSKLQLLYSVLELFEQIMNLEMFVPVRKICNSGDGIDDE